MPAGRFENRPQAPAHHDDGLIYMATDEGIVSAVVAATGQRVWRERIPGVYWRRASGRRKDLFRRLPWQPVKRLRAPTH